MDMAATRAELADAIAAVGGLTGHERAPDAPTEGDAWPRWRGASFDDGGVPGVAPMMRWALMIVLPAEVRSAEAYVEDRAADILDALLPVAYVESFEPVKITTDAGDLNGLLVNLRRE